VRVFGDGKHTHVQSHQHNQTVTSLESLSWNHCRSPFLHSAALNLLSSSIMAQKALIFAQPSHRMSFFCPSTYRAVAGYSSSTASSSLQLVMDMPLSVLNFILQLHRLLSSLSFRLVYLHRATQQGEMEIREIESNGSYPAISRMAGRLLQLVIIIRYT